MLAHEYERFRFTDIVDGRCVELDGIHVLTKHWPSLIREETLFASWRIAHLPSGWTVAIEPVAVALPRFLASETSCPDAGRGLASGGGS